MSRLPEISLHSICARASLEERRTESRSTVDVEWRTVSMRRPETAAAKLKLSLRNQLVWSQDAILIFLLTSANFGTIVRFSSLPDGLQKYST